MLHILGKTYGQRPSSFIGIDNNYLAYQFDTACLLVGLRRESEAVQSVNNNEQPIEEFTQTFTPTMVLPAGKTFEEFWKEL